MKLKTTLLLLFNIFYFNSCITPDYAYIRNLTNSVAIINVFLANKKEMKTLPNKVRFANQVVSFKGGYRKFLYNTLNVVWQDTSNFKFEMKPQSTADLSD